MDLHSYLWLLTLCAGISYWFYLNLEPTITNYAIHKHLVNSTTGVRVTPRSLLNLTNVLSPSEKYITETNSLSRLYDLIFQMNFANPFVVDQSYSSQEDLIKSAWPVANQSKCEQQLTWIVDKLQETPNYGHAKGKLGYELTNFMDSFGRPDSGLYSGTIEWLGSHRICMSTQLDEGNIKTRFCIGKFKSRNWPKDEYAYPKTGIRIGLCLPESCDTMSFGRRSSSQNIELLAKFDLTEQMKQNLYMESMFCLPDERSPLRKMPTSGLVYLSVVGGWLAMVVVFTIGFETYNYATRHKQRMEGEHNNKHIDVDSHGDHKTHQKSLTLSLMEALSLRNSLNSFKKNSFEVNYKLGERVRVNLGPLNFVKSNMAILVVMGHSGLLSMQYTRSLKNRIDFNVNELGRLSLSLVRCVDTFFVFFGVLTSYTLLRKLNLRQLSNPLVWVATNLGIMLRVTPIFWLAYWFSKSVAPFMASSPWWDYGVDKFSIKGICMAEPWWKSIPYLAGLGSPPVPACVLPAWFIVSYVQISLLLPTITYLICKLPNYLTRYLFLGFLSALSAASVGLTLSNQSVVDAAGFMEYGGFLALILDKYEKTGYLTTLGRLSGVSAGCFIGYLLRKYELRTIKKWPAWLINKTTIIVSIILHVVIIFLPVISFRLWKLTGHTPPKNQVAISSIALTMIWPVLNGILIIGLTSKYNHYVFCRFMSHSFWHAFNKLGLIIFLIHWEIISIGLTLFDEAPGYGFMTEVMKMWSFGLILSILAAFVLHITFEAPLTRITMILATCLITSFKNKASDHSSNGFDDYDDDDQTSGHKDDKTCNSINEKPHINK